MAETYPDWFWQNQLDLLIEQDEADARQREALVQWIADIDERRAKNEIERAKCQEALG